MDTQRTVKIVIETATTVSNPQDSNRPLPMLKQAAEIDVECHGQSYAAMRALQTLFNTGSPFTRARHIGHGVIVYEVRLTQFTDNWSLAGIVRTEHGTITEDGQYTPDSLAF